MALRSAKVPPLPETCSLHVPPSNIQVSLNPGLASLPYSYLVAHFVPDSTDQVVEGLVEMKVILCGIYGLTV